MTTKYTAMSYIINENETGNQYKRILVIQIFKCNIAVSISYSMSCFWVVSIPENINACDTNG